MFGRRKIIKHVPFLTVLLVAILCRIIGFGWDDWYGLHPDERLYVRAGEQLSWPSSVSELLSPQSPLNPQMFYYGSFPLYLYTLGTSILTQLFQIPYFYAFYGFSRFVSLCVSVLTIWYVYKIGKKYLSLRIGLLAGLLLALSPLAIQTAHFNTTESLLAFFAASITYYSLQLLHHQTIRTSLILGILYGLACSTKVIGFSLGVIPVLALLLHTPRTYRQIFQYGAILGLSGLIVYLLCSPYTIIDWAEFVRQQEYMQGVITGKYLSPAALIYEKTIPYWYHIANNFPWIFSFVMVPFVVIGWLAFGIKTIRSRNIIYLLLVAWPTCYFLIAGQWYAKFIRYLAPLVPFLSIVVAWGLVELTKLFPHRVRGFAYGAILAIQAITTIGFLTLYLQPHTRIQASHWIYDNISAEAMLLVEHWDDTLPLPLRGKAPHTFNIETLPSFEPDTDEKLTYVYAQLEKADYLILSSRRVYQAILNNRDRYPMMAVVYDELLDERLGFELVYTATRYPQFLWWEIPDDWSDESFQSYDHPPVLIFKK